MARKRAESEILSDITYLEMVLVVLACCLWKERFCSLKGHCLIFLLAIYQLFIKYFNIK